MTISQRRTLFLSAFLSAWAIVIVAFGHAAAALMHRYVFKDRVLNRMLPAG